MAAAGAALVLTLLLLASRLEAISEAIGRWPLVRRHATLSWIAGAGPPRRRRARRPAHAAMTARLALLSVRPRGCSKGWCSSRSRWGSRSRAGRAGRCSRSPPARWRRSSRARPATSARSTTSPRSAWSPTARRAPFAAAFAIVVHLMLWLPLTLAGVVHFIRPGAGQLRRRAAIVHCVERGLRERRFGTARRHHRGWLQRAGCRLRAVQARHPRHDPRERRGIGGLAGSFNVGPTRLEKFYHHWFTNDEHIPELVEELGQRDQVVFRPTRTGMYYANSFFKLSTPMDVLRFTPLPFCRPHPPRPAGAARPPRPRLAPARDRSPPPNGSARWAATPSTASCGSRCCAASSAPYAEQISAVWFWNKLKLRGGSRGKGGEEQLAYYRGGFIALADKMAEFIVAHGGAIHRSTRVDGLRVADGRVRGVVANGETSPPTSCWRRRRCRSSPTWSRRTRRRPTSPRSAGSSTWPTSAWCSISIAACPTSTG